MSNIFQTESMAVKATQELSEPGALMKYRAVPLLFGDSRDKTRRRTDANEVSLGILGTFVIGEEAICHTVLESKASEYQIKTDDVMAAIGTGLDLLGRFDCRESHIARCMVEDLEDFDPFEPSPDGRAHLLAGVRAMFDTEHGDINPDLVISTQLEDASWRARDYSREFSHDNPGAVESDSAVRILCNIDSESMKRLSVSFGQAMLPGCLDEFYRI